MWRGKSIIVIRGQAFSVPPPEESLRYQDGSWGPHRFPQDVWETLGVCLLPASLF